MKIEKIILASASPRRREILKENGIDFEVIVPSGDEKNIVGEKYSKELVNECAIAKAKSVAQTLGSQSSPIQEIVGADVENVGADTIRPTVGADTESVVGADIIRPVIVSCDTVVVNDGIIIGKPKDREDAIKILKSLSNKTHIVASSVCVMKGNDVKVAHETTKVTFRNLSEKDINDYINRCNPLDKAGSYGIQDEGFDFAVKVEGNIDNVIGFPMKAFNSIV
jgi:septum formation protein